MHRRRLLLASAGALLARSVPARAMVVLAAPFDAAAIRAGFRPSPRGARGRGCAAAPAPVRDLALDGFYTDLRASIPDPARYAASQAGARPLYDWLRAIQAGAEEWLRGGPADSAACTLAALDAWARGGALLGELNRQASYQRSWTLAGAATAFLAVREAPGLDPAALARVMAWFAAVGRAVQASFDRTVPNPIVNALVNNHATWAGYAVAAAGIAAGDPALLAWGLRRLGDTVDQVNRAGALPQELARGRMALHYHLFTLQALGPLLRIAEANRFGLSAQGEAALGRLSALVAASLADPGRMAALAGAQQAHLTDPTGSPAAHWRDAQGLEVLQGRRADPALGRLLAPWRPFREIRMGGNVTLIWGPRGAAVA